MLLLRNILLLFCSVPFLQVLYSRSSFFLEEAFACQNQYFNRANPGTYQSCSRFCPWTATARCGSLSRYWDFRIDDIPATCMCKGGLFPYSWGHCFYKYLVCTSRSCLHEDLNNITTRSTSTKQIHAHDLHQFYSINSISSTHFQCAVTFLMLSLAKFQTSISTAKYQLEKSAKCVPVQRPRTSSIHSLSSSKQ